MKRAFFLLSVAIPIFVSAQGFEKFGETIFQHRIKQMDEFFVRYNDCTTFNNWDDSTRTMALASLFDYDYLVENADNCLSFVNYVISEKEPLRFGDSNWSALADCKVKCNKKSEHLLLRLKVEEEGENIYKWVISEAKAPFLSLAPDKTSPSYRISPVDNELYFIHLNDITTNNPQDILNYGSKDYYPDETTVFFTLVHMGLLSVEYVEELNYEFVIGPYVVMVSFFPRESSNSGWLISEITQKTN